MNRFLKFLTKSYKSDRVSVYTGYASFFITISSVPFVALLLFLLGKLSPSLAESFESLLSSVIPNGLSDGLFDIIGKIKETDLSIFLPISIITAIWASCKGTLGVTRGIESVYEKDNKDIWILSILRIVLRTLVFALMVILSLVIFSVGRVLLSNIHPTTQALDFLLHILVKLRFFAFFLVLSLFFTIAYRCISSKKGILKHIPGALFSSTGWLAFTFLYSKYISYVLEKPSVYASMGTLVLFMLWIYFLVMIVLLGAEINKYFIKKRENEANLQTRGE